MTWDERVKAIADHGFTERQASFLVTVMLHSGVCLGRHYSAFARITHGQKVQDFFRKVVARKYATARRCGHNRARLYHFHHKPMYEAIGEPDNRHRRPLPLSRAVERLMVLDAVLGQRDLQWLATEREKVAYFTTVQRVPLADLPSLTFSSDAGQTVRRFTDKLPIGIGDDGRTYVFLYLVTRPLPADFRMFLERHAELWRALPAWSVRLLIPHHLSNSMNRYQEAFREQVGSPLVRRSYKSCGGSSRHGGPDPANEKTDSSIARNARSGPRGFGFSTAPGSSRATACWTRSSRPLWRLRSRVRPANSKHANWCIGISISLLWQARRDLGDTSARGRRQGR